MPEKTKSSLVIIIAAIAVLTLSCDPQRKQVVFYPVDSLMSAQVTNLVAEKAVLKKEAAIGGEMDDTLYTPTDTVQWNKELDIFRKLEAINKPVNRGYYLIEDHVYDPGSNLTMKSFVSTDTLPVRYFRIYYDGSLANPRRIEALYREVNSLYKSARLLEMEFQQIHNKTMLTSYSIAGGQKMILGDTVVFSVRGSIQIN